MSLFENFTMSFLYIILMSSVLLKEYNRTKQNGFDAQTVLIAFTLIYAIVPSIFIHTILGIYDSNIMTNIYFFDKVLKNINITDSLTIFFLLSFFIFGVYITSKNTNNVLKKNNYIILELREKSAAIINILLLLICLKFFIDLGSNFSERYSKLILFRSLDIQAERTFFSANAFSITQTLSWLSASMFYISFSRKKIFLSLLYLIIMLTGVFLMGSRRAIIFAILIIYFSFCFGQRDLKISKIIWFFPLFLFLIAFGKEIAWFISIDQRADIALNQYTSISSLLLRSFCDIGITQISSFAVFQHFDFDIRFGIDHILSILRRFPDGLLGLDVHWPERIVRITTEAFTNRDDADIAPGLIGQSWFDLPVLGAFFWGIAIGFQLYFLNKFSSKYKNSPEKSALVVLLSLIISLPINTGSFDFTFSIDIMLLILILFFIFKVKKISSFKTTEA